MDQTLQRPSLTTLSLFSAGWYFSVVGGFIALAVAVARIDIADGVRTSALVCLVVMALFTELRPVIVPGKDSNGIVASYAFVMAILYVFGFPAAVLTLAAATFLSELIEHREPWKIFFNIGQHALCIVAAWSVMEVFGQKPTLQNPTLVIHASDVAWMPLTWVVFFIVNHLLIVSVSADKALTPKEALLENLAYYILTLFAVLSLSPIIALVSVQAWPMLLLFILP